MPAIRADVSFSRLTPLMWNAIPTPVSAQGTWTQLLQAAAWSGVSGASDAPKSTVRDVICWMPAPEPTLP